MGFIPLCLLWLCFKFRIHISLEHALTILSVICAAHTGEGRVYKTTLTTFKRNFSAQTTIFLVEFSILSFWKRYGWLKCTKKIVFDFVPNWFSSAKKKFFCSILISFSSRNFFTKYKHWTNNFFKWKILECPEIKQKI